MKIDRVIQYHVQMPLKHPFETSFGRQTVVDKVILAIHAGGLIGYGESPVDEHPYYAYETIDTCWSIQQHFLIPALLDADLDHAADFGPLVRRVRGYPMAKAGLEAALWDLEAQMVGESVASLLGGMRTRVDSGVSIGIQESVDALLARIEAFLIKGYRRIKIKIKPGWDVRVVEAVRVRFPDIRLMVDANSAYTLDDASHLQALDDFDLLMIEQPLAYDDILDHAALQARLQTPICLDESINSVGRAREALHLGSCRIINVKPARVGGWANARTIHDLCQAQDVPVWCGGLLESGIGRAHNLALASLPNFSLPGDISATDRYWDEDITEPPFVLNAGGTLDVPAGPGLGIEVLPDRLEKWTLRTAISPAGSPSA